MRIVHFGTYSTQEGYPRNAVIRDALEAAGVEVMECRREAWGDSASRVRDATSITAAVIRLFRIIKAWISLSREYLRRTPDHDLVIVGYPGHLDVFLARLLGRVRSRPVVLDAFLSLYEALVEDRKLLMPGSMRASLLKFLDRAGSKAADAVLLDTTAHIRYYRDVIGVAPEKFIRVFVSAQEVYFHPPDPTPSQNSGEVLFFGSFLPLHGADVIVKTAIILEDEENIHFTMIGDGPDWERCRSLARETGAGINWERGWLDYHDLADRISRSEICLGIFSSESKAARVIPCKVFNVLAMGKPLITADTAAAAEALTHCENAFLVPPGDPEALAEAVKKLHADSALRDRIASAGLSTFRERFSRKPLGKELAEQLERRFGPGG